jgi:antitoxin component YwqK of YwqJK toxin-antitoxin module
MEHGNVLDIREVMDESRHIRRRIYPKGDSNWVPHGRYTVFRENGSRLLEICYRQGVLHGPYVSFWPDGKVSSEGSHCEGKQEGIWHFYNENGTIHAIIQFKDDKEIDSAQYIYNEDGTLSDIIQLNEFRRGKGTRDS